MADQVVIGGFTITFNGIAAVSGGYQWSYTITNDGTEQDLSNWVLELIDCTEIGEKIPCSSGQCEIHEQVCPPGSGSCTTFSGVKFDNLPPNQPIQHFSFILPYNTTTEGCFYLKYGLTTKCGTITVPRCTSNPPCVECPQQSLQFKKTFTQTINLPSSVCLHVGDTQAHSYLCPEKIQISDGTCEETVDVIVCENTSNPQQLNCPIDVNYVHLHGELQIVWQLTLDFQSVCTPGIIPLTMMTVSQISIDEVCYSCADDYPHVTPENLCDWFLVEFVSLDTNGKLTFTVEFSGCEE
jgi:hypothetical protein